MFLRSAYLSALVFEAFKVSIAFLLGVISKEVSGKKVKIPTEAVPLFPMFWGCSVLTLFWHPTVLRRQQKGKSCRSRAKSGHRDKNWFGHKRCRHQHRHHYFNDNLLLGLFLQMFARNCKSFFRFNVNFPFFLPLELSPPLDVDFLSAS